MTTHYENALGLALCGAFDDAPQARDAGEVDCPACLDKLVQRTELDMRDQKNPERLLHLWKRGQAEDAQGRFAGSGGTYCGSYSRRHARYFGARSICRKCAKLRQEEIAKALAKEKRP